MKIKCHHAVAILEYVSLANQERGGMITLGRIQAHLLDKFGVLFKKGSIRYCLKKRLGIHFSDAGKPTITFTPERRRSAIVFCKSLNEALKLERAGTHIIVYMDESYCQSNRAGLGLGSGHGLGLGCGLGPGHGLCLGKKRSRCEIYFHVS